MTPLEKADAERMKSIAPLVEAEENGDTKCEYDHHDSCWYVQSNTHCETIPFLLRKAAETEPLRQERDELRSLLERLYTACGEDRKFLTLEALTVANDFTKLKERYGEK